jgi:acetolactate synthase I/II/III large subunit
MIVPVRTAPRVLTAPVPRTVSQGLVDALVALGVERAFGVFGGAIAPFCEAVSRSSIELVHCRHEAGAAFAAIEASLASDRPTVVVSTSGPGLTNLFTGMVAARAEGAKVLFVSGCTPAAQRGRGAFQETSATSSPLAALFATGTLFHHATVLEDPAELEPSLARLATGFSRKNGYVAHLGLPLSLQSAVFEASPRSGVTSVPPPVPHPLSVAACAELLATESFVIWAGFGARHASESVRQLAERTGARVMCSPRGKGVMPEGHPLFLGVTGLGGHAAVEAYLREARPRRALVLGSRLGEMVSFWSPELVPEDGLIHVDLDADVFGCAYPGVPTLGVQGEIGAFLDELLLLLPERPSRPLPLALVRPREEELETREHGAVRPSFLMQMIQHVVVEGSDAVVLTEAGNSFALGSHHLRFEAPGRYRVSTSFGSMGQASTGVLGAALACKKAVAIVGDGAMLMNNEINTAANYGVGAVWIVLNDARYGMIEQGMESVGWQPFETDFPRTDFVAVARAMGGDGVRVDCEADLEAALQAGLASLGPFLIDVIIDPSECPPAGRRNQSLQSQGLSSVPHLGARP